MSEKGKRFIEIISKAIPGLSDQELDRLLLFGEMLIFMTARKKLPADRPSA